MQFFKSAILVACATLLTLATWQKPAPTVAETHSVTRDGFVDEFVAQFGNGEIPTGMAATPDGRILVALKNGKLRVIEFGAVLPAPALDISDQICNDSERGLESVAVDPNFATNGFIYVFYTWKSSELVCDLSALNRVMRYTLRNNLAVEPVAILDRIPSPGSAHNSGDIAFGPDGLMYISVGDGGEDFTTGELGAENHNATYLSVLNGKILRLNPDGSVPISNPYVSMPGAVRCAGKPYSLVGGPCTETFAWGFRNPFKIAFKPGTNELYANDVGQGAWEEINIVTAGANYGWNLREGNCLTGSTVNCGAPPAGMTNPIYQHVHQGRMCAITGAAFATTAWPDPYRGRYYFGDYCDNKIYVLTSTVDGLTYDTFHSAGDLGGVIDLMFDPVSRSLYYSLGYNYVDSNIQGSIRRLRFIGDNNRAPTAALSASKTAGPAPLQVRFSAAGSIDPDEDPLSFELNLGDGTPVLTTGEYTHTYTGTTPVQATLVAIDSNGARSTAAVVRIFPGNRPPVPVILAPEKSQKFSVNQLLTLRGAATDPDSGPMPDTTLTWRMLVHHIPESNISTRHTHPFFSGVGSGLPLQPMPEPEDLDAARLGYIEILLTATEPNGPSTTISQVLEPALVPLTFASEPLPFIVRVNNRGALMPYTLTTWQNQTLTVDVPEPQTGLSGGAMRFGNWSDSAQQTRLLRTPAIATTYTVNFKPGVDQSVVNIYRVMLPGIEN